MNTSLIKRVEMEIYSCEDNQELETTLEISYSELLLIRRYLLEDDYRCKLSIENLKRAKREFGGK